MGMLEFTETQLLSWLNSVLWPFLRVLALLIAAPLFGARTVPMPIRIGLALMIAVLVAPLYPADSTVQPLSLLGAVTAAREILIGVTLGFFLQMLFAAMAMAGEIVALSMGLAFASMVDPERGTSVPLVGQYFVIFATLLFLAFDGHLALLVLLVQSFDPLPPGGTALGAAPFWELVAWGSRMFESAVFVALPAAAALLLSNVSMGMIARSAPQLNIFAVGFPMTLLLGIVMLLLTLPGLGDQVETVAEQVFEAAGGLFGAAP
jgi:flagellar biosynthesis protein FliR